MEKRKLCLRPMKAEDLPALHALLSDAEIMRYLEPPFSLEKTRAFLETAGLSRPSLIEAIESEGVFLGYAICHPYDERSTEIGWVLRREFQGRGYAQETTRMLLRRIRRENRAAVIECAPEQAASRRIAEKFGFRQTEQRDGLLVFRLEAERAAEETEETSPGRRE